jgi:hypothetical protein
MFFKLTIECASVGGRCHSPGGLFQPLIILPRPDLLPGYDIYDSTLLSIFNDFENNEVQRTQPATPAPCHVLPLRFQPDALRSTHMVAYHVVFRILAS